MYETLSKIFRAQKRHHFSELHFFSGDEAFVESPGFSRFVFCNDPSCYEASTLAYPYNYARTTKYSILSFLPKALYEQFRRVANIFFLICAVLSFTPLSPYSPVSSVVPFVVVVGVTMGKEMVEDLRRRKQDVEVNNREVKVHKSEGVFQVTTWRKVKVGHIVRIENNNVFPADIILLSSSNPDGVCYVETSNLDGETNLKLKKSIDASSPLVDDDSFKHFKAVIKCEDPNANLYAFTGTLGINEQRFPLSLRQLLLRDSKLRNADFIYGVVVFTGHDTKVMQNATPPPSKRSKMDKRTDKIVFCLFFALVSMSFVGSIVFGLETRDDLKNGKMTRYYLRPDDTTMYYDPNRPVLAAVLQFFTGVMLYSYFIPISLYVTVEIVKVFQSLFINNDQKIYYEKTDQPARARTSNLTDELGQVETILSDKTGTLTCNSMEFIKCSIAGTSYGQGVTEGERAFAENNFSYEEIESRCEKETRSVKGYNFMDDRITNNRWANEAQATVIQTFLKSMAICNTAVPEIDEASGEVSYEAESPDEAAFVIAARELGIKLVRRTHSHILLHEFDPFSRTGAGRWYELLTTIEFTSSRKRMSVIVRDENKKILLFSKGADSVMLRRLGRNGREFEEQSIAHINEYADAGLRVLVIAYREVDESEFREFSEEYAKATNSVRADREELIELAADKIERDLILLGATAVEDKLQQGVPECIDKLATAGIKIWVLTGDKMETAVNIGFACRLLRQEMKQIIISSETAVSDLKASAVEQLNMAKTMIESFPDNSEASALIIDGNSLTQALENDAKDVFLDVAMECSSVICCRTSPKQKALVTRLIKDRTSGTTLAIGDGANDVGMLQEADVGIGISGVEGMQAMMSSDVAIGQFRFLERLLLLHGHWSYTRISSMICYFLYKNILFGWTLFLYEAYAGFSGQTLFNTWFLSLYNVVFTSLPVIALGIFDQDVPASFCLKFPMVYRKGARNVMFGWFRIGWWALNGVISGAAVFYLCTSGVGEEAFRRQGEVMGMEIMGVTMYTCVILVVSFQMALSVNYATYVQHIVLWGGILWWFVFLVGYGSLYPDISTTAYRVFVEECAPSPSFWIICLFVAVSSVLPYFTFSALQMSFFPMYHQMDLPKLINFPTSLLPF